MNKIKIEITVDDEVDTVNKTQDTEVIFTNLYYSTKKCLEDMGISNHKIIVGRDK